MRHVFDGAAVLFCVIALILGMGPLKRWKPIAYATIAGAVLLMCMFGFFDFTFPWEVSWVKSAALLTLDEPEETLAGSDLHNLLEGFESDNQMGLSCQLGKRNGHIQVDGETYSIEYAYDKFLGDVLAVHRRWKTVEVVRRNPTFEQRQGMR